MILTLPLDICVIALFVLACAGLGRMALGFFTRPDSEPAAGDFLLSTGLGLFAFSYLSYALGLAGLVYRPVFLSLFAVAVWLGRKEISVFFRRFGEIRPGPLSRVEKLLLAVIFTAAVFNFFYNYCPPCAEDEISTYLGIPAKWARAHAIYALPGASAQYFPYGVLADYLALVSAGSVQAARLFHYVSGLFCLLCVWLLARRFLDRSQALLACVLFYTMPMVTSLSGVGNTDLGTLFYALLAVYAFAGWLSSKEPRALMLAAVLAGAHAACKYTAFPLLIIFPLAVVYEERKRLAGAVKSAAAFAAVSFAALIPYLARTAALTGNPLYPARLLPGLKYDGLLYLGHLKKQSFFDLPGMMANFSSAGDIIWGIGPVFAAFLPAVFLFRLRDKDGRDISMLLLGIAALNVLLLFMAHISFQLTRHSLLSFALLSIPVAYAAERLCAVRTLRGYIAALISLSLITNLALSLYFGGKRLPVFFGLQSRKNYFDRGYDFWEKSFFVSYINRNIREGAGIFFMCNLGAPQLNYPRHRVFGMDAFGIDFYGLSPLGVSAEFEKAGIEYVVVVWDNFKSDGARSALWKDGGAELPVEWLRENFLKPVISHDNVTLYSVAKPGEVSRSAADLKGV
ncbi:MAG: glycosyltransferase family 39 protein [Elusimicrobia bacterium]|nr:glycosyltransferase family 39 protein [Elusimicrobiota bacterium]